MDSPQNPKADPFVIAIDGPAGAGKSTIAKRLAQIYTIAYLDTGAMYRSITLKALRAGTDMESEEALVSLARATVIELKATSDGLCVLLDGEDVSQDIRTPEVTNNAFYIARAPRVRDVMVEWQRAIGGRQSVVAEGRDIGTVVFPGAAYKFYLDADVNERTQRRLKDLEAAGKAVAAEELKATIEQRDHSDMNRSVGALKVADDATVIDTTGLSIEDVVQVIVGHVNSAE